MTANTAPGVQSRSGSRRRVQPLRCVACRSDVDVGDGFDAPAANAATTCCAADIATVQVGAAPADLQAPSQPVNVAPEAGVSVSVTLEPCG